MGQGPAQILRIPGFMNSKTDGENATVLSEFRCDLQKKGLQGKVPPFSQDFDVTSKKKKKRCSVFHMLISMGPLLGLLKPMPPPPLVGPATAIGYCVSILYYIHYLAQKLS